MTIVMAACCIIMQKYMLHSLKIHTLPMMIRSDIMNTCMHAFLEMIYKHHEVRAIIDHVSRVTKSVQINDLNFK